MKRVAINLASAWLVLAMAVGCASLGIQPETFNERLVSAYASVTTVRDTTTVLVNRDVITANDAQNIQNTANQVRTGLDIADQLHRIRPRDGEDKLVATLRILHALEAYLAEVQK